MPNIGDLSGEIHDITIVHDFGWFGENIRVNPELSPLELIDIAEEIVNTEDESGVGEILIVKKMFRNLVDPRDFDLFWSIAKKQRVDMEQLQVVQKRVIEYVSARPTLPLSSSSDGPKSISTSSDQKPDLTDSPLTAMDRRVAEREMEGRPDLRLALVNVAEHRHSA